MITLKIGDKQYKLLMNVYTMELMEAEFGSMEKMFEQAETGRVSTVMKMFRCLANSALYREGKEENITGKELRNLNVPAINGISKAIRAAVDEGMKAEMVDGNEADDEVYDVYLAEIEAKN